MAFNLVISSAAKNEYEAIAAYLAETVCNPKAAAEFCDEFDWQLSLVCEMPYMRSLSHLPELAALGYRSVCVGNYVILYKVMEDMVYVAHIFHQRQDYARLV